MVHGQQEFRDRDDLQMNGRETGVNMQAVTGRSVLLILAAYLVAGSVGCETLKSRKLWQATRVDKPAGEVMLSEGQVSDIQLTLARTLEQQGDLTGAMDGYKRVLELDHSNATAAWRVAVLYDRQGQPLQSESWYQRALQQAPENPEILADFGYSLYLKKRWSESEEYLTRSLKLSPENRRVRNNLGLLYAQTERRDMALEAFRKSGCSPAESFANVGLVATMNGDVVQAEEMFRKSLAADPSCTTAVQGLAAIQKTATDRTALAGAPDTDASGRVQLTSWSGGKE